MTHGERGEHVTAHICFSASGEYMPPLIIFPRKNYNADFLSGMPEGASVEFYPTGYMTFESFYRWMKDFIKFVKPTAKRRILLIFDGHVTHVKNEAALQLAKDSYVICLVLPPHCTHKIHS